jgi:hypothetical protein
MLNPQLTLAGSAGFEFDTAHLAGINGARGVFFGGGGPASASLGADDQNFRPTASFGGSYETAANQVIVAGITYRQESFHDTNTVGITAAYQIGF